MLALNTADHMSEHCMSKLCRQTNERREARIIRALGSAYPKSIPAKQLMIRSGFRFHADPFWSFVALCNAFYSINRNLKDADF